MFDLRLDRRLRDRDAEGEIAIGDTRKTFHVDLSLWDVEDYRASWRRSIALVLNDGFARFLVSVGEPGQAMFDTWPCWRRGDEVLLINAILLSSITGDFARPQDAEVFDNEGPGPATTQYACALADLVDFERRLTGAARQ
ncbi:MAG TPA: hypothetical protein VG841_12060 [Caulobacterales bacterium]|nr:hypothetical protein [Caulobacterales bacterium]